MNEEKELSDREAHKEFWKEFNDVCKECINKCKQSSQVIVVHCPDFKKVV